MQEKAFGVFFISIAVGIAMASIITEIAIITKASIYLYPVIWITILAGSISLFKQVCREMFSEMRKRFSQSASWPIHIKIINGICWALPFILIPFFPTHYLSLVLLGIGLGNISTYMIMRRMKMAFTGQMIVGSIALASIPFLFALDLSFAIENDLRQMIARLMIAVAYGAGGTYTVLMS